MGNQANDNFIQRMELWKSAVNDQTTGITVTLEQMLWDYAAFCTAIKSLQLANHRARDRGEGSEPSVNKMLYDLLARGYWANLLLGVRRLLDNGDLTGARGVLSLRAILKDVKAKRAKLTRIIYVQHLCGCEYDFETLARKDWETNMAAGRKVWWGNPERLKSEFAHKNFDDLSGVSQHDRSEDDLIDQKIFDLLEERLAKLDNICDHVSSHIAHSGNNQSRKEKGLEYFDIRDAKEALKALKQSADLIARWFAFESPSNLAVYQGDQFEALDRSILEATDLPILESNWNAIENEIATWKLEPEELLCEA